MLDKSIFKNGPKVTAPLLVEMFVISSCALIRLALTRKQFEAETLKNESERRTPEEPNDYIVILDDESEGTQHEFLIQFVSNNEL